MRLEQQQALIDRLLAHHAAATTDLGPQERFVPMDCYTSPERYEREWQLLFRSLPLILAPVSRVAKPGDFLTSDDYGVPILVTRDQDGKLHAFLNACTHRGARLVSDELGCGKKAFNCPYHGWTFGNDGRLLNITHAECFPAIGKEQHGLKPLPVQERFGFVWVVLDPEGQIDVDAYVGELAPELDALELDRHVPYLRYERDFPVNWKIYQENFLEGYHVPYAHSEVVTATRDTGILVDRFGFHIRVTGPRHSLPKLAQLDRHRWRLRPNSFVTYFFFPNTMVNIEPDHAMWQRVYPKRVDASHIVHDLLVPETAQDEWWREYWQKAHKTNIAAFEEDVSIIDNIWQGMATGWLPDFVFGLREPALVAFHEAIDAVLADGAR